MLACSAHCGPSVDADASVRHLSALWSCAAAGAAKRNFVVADFYFLEMSYLPGPISPPVLEMSYLPSRTRFLSPHTVVYVAVNTFFIDFAFLSDLDASRLFLPFRVKTLHGGRFTIAWYRASMPSKNGSDLRWQRTNTHNTTHIRLYPAGTGITSPSMGIRISRP